MPNSVNTAFVLDMQRKLYRWTAAKPIRSLRMCSILYATAELCLLLGKGWPAIAVAKLQALMG